MLAKMLLHCINICAFIITCSNAAWIDILLTDAITFMQYKYSETVFGATVLYVCEQTQNIHSKDTPLIYDVCPFCSKECLNLNSKVTMEIILHIFVQLNI